jgi:3,4-dihydroxy 2-butanone 4-phosphate synthase / GTP cyclohydrolase II
VSFVPIEEALADVRNGRMVIVCDSQDRENEGDLVMAAQFATPAAVNFMTREARGLLCLALSAERCRDLGSRSCPDDSDRDRSRSRAA